MGTMIGVCFILTMRNVNLEVEIVETGELGGFILTMRNVNTYGEGNGFYAFPRFILTMRNVNKAEDEEEKK